MATAPHAFLSYTHVDDKALGGAITKMRKGLELLVQAVTGDRTFTIFQDIEGIEFGQHWPSRLDQALASARFLIPVLSPLFFKSEPCRNELAKFLELECRAQRRDLILPLYLFEALVLESPELRASDPLAQVIHERQYRDWRSYTKRSIDRRAIHELADAVAAAIYRTSSRPAAQPEKPERALIGEKETSQ
jgi:hypothetical protein